LDPSSVNQQSQKILPNRPVLRRAKSLERQLGLFRFDKKAGLELTNFKAELSPQSLMLGETSKSTPICHSPIIDTPSTLVSITCTNSSSAPVFLDDQSPPQSRVWHQSSYPSMLRPCLSTDLRLTSAASTSLLVNRARLRPSLRGLDQDVTAKEAPQPRHHKMLGLHRSMQKQELDLQSLCSTSAHRSRSRITAY
jgi:hypothetical protein